MTDNEILNRLNAPTRAERLANLKALLGEAKALDQSDGPELGACIGKVLVGPHQAGFRGHSDDVEHLLRRGLVLGLHDDSGVLAAEGGDVLRGAAV